MLGGELGGRTEMDSTPGSGAVEAKRVGGDGDGTGSEAAAGGPSWEGRFAAGQAKMDALDYEGAVEDFGAALEQAVPIHGQFGKELARVYVQYGLALLQLGTAKQEDTLLNAGAVPESVLEGMAQRDAAGSSAKRAKVIDLDDVTFEGECEEGDDASDASDAEDAGEVSDAEDAGDASDDGSSKSENEGDDFELAWEVFDIARVIYADSQSVSEQASKSLADVHTYLGDVSMETESFGRAAEDFASAIAIKRGGGAGQERSLAATLFKYSLALEYDNRLAEAVAPLEEAHAILSDRLALLQDADDGKGKEALVAGAGGEADELAALLPDVATKLEELRSQVASGQPGLASSSKLRSGMNAAALGAIQDLSGLVKKRAPPPS